MAIPRTLKNYAAYIDGRGYAGRIDVTLPELTLQTEDYSAGGLSAVVKVDMGLVEAVDVQFTLKEYDPDVLSMWGLAKGQSLPLVARGAEQGEDGTVREVRMDLRGLFYQVNMGQWQGGERPAIEGTVNARWYRLRVDGQDVHEIDVENMKRVVGGVDQLEAIRRAIGV
ncbi:phage major tail tube protein [Vibrio injensis]|uniref:phage major tail tube protein n=1 Tax=Vibrio injensis TaxID=1307414 RepID=UPI000932F39E|nr:phage major tail tube protein [Vibrio injensis]